jgi:hypothetical protein
VASKTKKPDFYKQFVRTIDGVKCFVLTEDRADEFFSKFLEDENVCSDGTEHKDELLNKLFGLQNFTINATTFAEAEVTLSIRAKSKAEAIKLARTRYEGKETPLESEHIEFKTKSTPNGDQEKFVLRDVRPKITTR